MFSNYIEEQKVKDLFELDECHIGYDECGVCKARNVCENVSCHTCKNNFVPLASTKLRK